ncbi:aspartate/methionine/tyrosine aminotransferase [Amaricoccus macauensis]|uniref:aspartate transaminase n=1 Tax=Amaricoccus macauensis TaxID=57001 RepID=A0A840SPQ1_9RHOB|nr:aminotransferase [Amaricoccus macauensis]MBB5221363.1 aspartate/methionine/tyrosine aminotransferase [Amaricoccus macauensis]
MPPLNPLVARTAAPPVMEARRWLAGVDMPSGRPLINLSQAAPVEPPPEALREAMAEMVRAEDDTHLYGPVLGLPALRSEIAWRWSAAYGGAIEPEDVAITAGCNQAFATAIMTLAEPGDAVLLPVPWYFNHKMWLDLCGIEAIPLPCDDAMLPDLAAAAALWTPRTRAVALVTPNNPTGAEYPPALIAGFAELAGSRGGALVLDETYRDFASSTERPHDLFTDAGWRDTLIHLYSFSKSFRLTGHRTGAMIASPDRLAEAEKILDTVTICPPQLGQKSALWGLRNLGDWLAAERLEILRRRDAAFAALSALPGWRVLGCGAYFAYVEHPFDIPSSELCPKLVRDQSLLMLPGTMFAPDGDERAKRQLRLAFANVGVEGLGVLGERLAGVGEKVG